MNLQDAIVTLQMYQDAHRSGTVELNSQLMLQELPYAVEVVLDHLLPKNQHPASTPTSPEEERERKEQQERFSRLLNGEL
jgi:hypothetical protein